MSDSHSAGVSRCRSGYAPAGDQEPEEDARAGELPGPAPCAIRRGIASEADFRFRDTNLLYLSAEDRWEAAAGLELTVFCDTGKVFPDSSDFDLDNRNESYGFGMRGKSMRRACFVSMSAIARKAPLSMLPSGLRSS